MKNLKMLYIALIALVAGAFSACTTDYEPGPQAKGPQVMFLANNPTSLEFTGDVNENTQKLTLARVEKDEALSVYLLTEIAEGDESIFSIPEEVVFAAGEATAELVYTVDQSKLANDKTYTVNFIIADENLTTSYGYNEWKVKYALNPWELVKDSKGNNAKGKFRGVSAIDAFWGVASAEEFDVDIYKHKNLQQYKIADPWVKVYMLGLEVESEEILAGQFSWTNADLIVDFTDPTNVKIPTQKMGISEDYYGYGEAYIAGSGGTLEDGVITFPKGGIGYAHINATGGSLIPCNEDGLFRIVLPGVEVADYSLAVAYDGMDVTADDKVFAKFKFSYGDDVTNVKYLILNGNWESKANEALTTLFAGEDKNILSIPDFVQGSKVANVKVGLEPGVYTIVTAPADKSGELRAKEAIVKSFPFKGIGAEEEHPCVLEVSTKKMSETVDIFGEEEVAANPDYVAFAFNIVGEQIKSCRYYINTSAVIADLLSMGMTFDSVLSEYGRDIAIERLSLINSEGGMASYFSGLNPDTEYLLLVYGKNEYDEETIVYATHATDAVPYDGEFVIGQYDMYSKYVYGEGANDFIESDCRLTIEPQLINNVASETEFFVSGLGTDTGTRWYATYDSAAGTFTVSGIEEGYENYGCQFGTLYGYANKEQTEAFGFYSFASETSKGNDPLVLTVDATTKQLSGMGSYQFSLPIFDMTTGKQVASWGDYFGSVTTFTLVKESDNENSSDNEDSGASTASVMSTNSLSVKVPFSSVNVSKINDVSRFAMKPAIKMNFSSLSTNSGILSVKPFSVEKYTPAKVKGFTKVKANAAAIRR